MAARLDPQHTIGRIYGTDWTIANVAKLLRFNAGQGKVRGGPLTGGTREVNQNYLRTTSARHLPTETIVTFRRDPAGNYEASICFAGLDDYLPWNEAVAEEWLAALFLEHRSQARPEFAAATDRVRRFVLTV